MENKPNKKDSLTNEGQQKELVENKTSKKSRKEKATVNIEYSTRSF